MLRNILVSFLSGLLKEKYLEATTSLTQGVPEAMREAVIGGVSAWVNGGSAIPDSELTLRHASGSPVDVFSSHLMLPGVAGGQEMYCIDISLAERKAAEKALRASEQALRAIIDQIPDPIVVKDRKGNFLLGNQAVATLYNTTPQAMVGKHDDDFGVPKEMAEFFRENVLAIMARGQTEVVFEDSRDANSGEIFHYRSIKKPYKNDDGESQILVVAQNITDVIRGQQQVAESEKRLQQIMEITHEGIWDWHLPSERVLHNAQWYKTLLYEPGEVAETAKAFSELIHPADRDLLWGRLGTLLSGESDTYHSEHRMLRKDGSLIWVKDRGCVVERDAQGKPTRVIGSFSDISLQMEHQARLEELAHYDSLTGMANRSLLADRLQQAMASALRRGSTIAVAYLDLDGFKAVNDAHGHQMGDHLLTVVAARMKNALREVDTLGRLGGDEFVAVMTDLPNVDACLPMLQRLLDAASQEVIGEGNSVQVSASLGVTFYPQAEDIDADQLLRQADQAMYQAKLSGKNRYQLFDIVQDRAARGHYEYQERIRQGLAKGEFVLYYQPKVNMRTGAVIGMEALIRWQHPERGLLLPGVFLPFIEDDSVAVDVCKWVIDAALTQVSAWRGAGLRLPISVNVGARELQEVGFAPRLRGMLEAHGGLPGSLLEIEVLESSALQDITKVSQVIKDCAAFGIQFALDDFGTGYSSLTYLKRLSAHTLKIDQSFVRDMLDDPDDLAIIQGVLGLATAFRRQAVAEGVESVPHGEMLLDLGCELAQGYGIARPMPAMNVHAWTAAWRPDSAWLNRPVRSRDDLPALVATVEHRAWIAVVGAYLQQDVNVPEPDCDNCRFCAWLEDDGLARYGDRTIVQAIAEFHRDLHESVDALLLMKQKGRGAEALHGLAKIRAQQDALMAQMRQLL